LVALTQCCKLVSFLHLYYIRSKSDFTIKDCLCELLIHAGKTQSCPHECRLSER